MYLVRYGNELHQSVVYVYHLNITLVHAQNVNASFNICIIIVGIDIVEICALFVGDAIVGWPLTHTNPIDHRRVCTPCQVTESEMLRQTLMIT